MDLSSWNVFETELEKYFSHKEILAHMNIKTSSSGSLESSLGTWYLPLETPSLDIVVAGAGKYMELMYRNK